MTQHSNRKKPKTKRGSELNFATEQVGFGCFKFSETHYDNVECQTFRAVETPIALSGRGRRKVCVVGLGG
jgi:hypothetical protein